jgi:hypothetical protein
MKTEPVPKALLVGALPPSRSPAVAAMVRQSIELRRDGIAVETAGLSYGATGTYRLRLEDWRSVVGFGLFLGRRSFDKIILHYAGESTQRANGRYLERKFNYVTQYLLFSYITSKFRGRFHVCVHSFPTEKLKRPAQKRLHQLLFGKAARTEFASEALREDVLGKLSLDWREPRYRVAAALPFTVERHPVTREQARKQLGIRDEETLFVAFEPGGSDFAACVVHPAFALAAPLRSHLVVLRPDWVMMQADQLPGGEQVKLRELDRWIAAADATIVDASHSGFEALVERSLERGVLALVQDAEPKIRDGRRRFVGMNLLARAIWELDGERWFDPSARPASGKPEEQVVAERVRPRILLVDPFSVEGDPSKAPPTVQFARLFAPSATVEILARERPGFDSSGLPQGVSLRKFPAGEGLIESLPDEAGDFDAVLLMAPAQVHEDALARLSPARLSLYLGSGEVDGVPQRKLRRLIGHASRIIVGGWLEPSALAALGVLSTAEVFVVNHPVEASTRSAASERETAVGAQFLDVSRHSESQELTTRWVDEAVNSKGWAIELVRAGLSRAKTNAVGYIAAIDLSSSGHPEAILEALYSGCPVIVHRENRVASALVEVSGAGFVVADASEFQTAVEALAFGRRTRNELGARGRAYVADHHGAASVGGQLLAALGLGS